MDVTISNPFSELTVVAWNANGLNERRAELVQFILDIDADVVMLGETWFRPADKFTIANYAVHRSDRLTGRGGGVAIAIKKHLRHSFLPVPDLRSLEAVGVRIRVRGFGPLNLFSVYAPPTRVFVPEDYDSLFGSDTPALVAGDLNRFGVRSSHSGVCAGGLCSSHSGVCAGGL
ncbi:Endonuclease-reverse transcriptase [Popillia japonica]|uniref:Endonuclease-reverse transcriptase n=1 Tax=Popillia japonica TaxID=7064 RepID=A0AAW1LEC8_POPJA